MNAKQLTIKIQKLTNNNFHNHALIEGLKYLDMFDEHIEMLDIVRIAEREGYMSHELINRRHVIYKAFWEHAEKSLTKKVFKELKAAF